MRGRTMGDEVIHGLVMSLRDMVVNKFLALTDLVK